MKEKDFYNKRELAIITFAVTAICLAMIAIGFDMGRNYEINNPPKNEIVDKGGGCQ